MKIHVKIPKNYIWFVDLSTLLLQSLHDIGHILTDEEEADLIIVIQSLEGEQVPGKKYVLILTEQRQFVTQEGKLVLGNSFKPDKIWSSDYGFEDTEYLVLGYHPCMEFQEDRLKDINVSLLGSITARRRDFMLSVKNKISVISQWKFVNKIDAVKRSRINLNLHSYGETSYTEWGRLSLLLANHAFVLSEKLYCPLPVIQFSSPAEYDELVDYYLTHEKEREEIAESTYQLYKTNYDMRDIMIEKLKNI